MASATHAVAHEGLDEQERLLIDQTIARNGSQPGALLGILETVQSANAHKFLSMDALRYIAAETGIPPSRVYSAATFYALFNLDPQGDNVICVCRGTACHTRGSRDLLGQALPRPRRERPRNRREQRSRQDGHHHAGSPLHHPHCRLLRPVRAGARRRSQSPHSESCE